MWGLTLQLRPGLYLVWAAVQGLICWWLLGLHLVGVGVSRVWMTLATMIPAADEGRLQKMETLLAQVQHDAKVAQAAIDDLKKQAAKSQEEAKLRAGGGSATGKVAATRASLEGSPVPMLRTPRYRQGPLALAVVEPLAK